MWIFLRPAIGTIPTRKEMKLWLNHGMLYSAPMAGASMAQRCKPVTSGGMYGLVVSCGVRLRRDYDGGTGWALKRIRRRSL